MSETNEMTLATTEDLYEMFGDPVEKFEPFAYYNSAGDCVEFFAKGDMHYGDWIDHYLTLYRSKETDEIIGCVITNIRSLCRKLESDNTQAIGFHIRDDTICFQFLLFALWNDKSQTESAPIYQKLTALAVNNHIDGVKLSC